MIWNGEGVQYFGGEEGRSNRYGGSQEEFEIERRF